MSSITWDRTIEIVTALRDLEEGDLEEVRQDLLQRKLTSIPSSDLESLQKYDAAIKVIINIQPSELSEMYLQLQKAYDTITAELDFVAQEQKP